LRLAFDGTATIAKRNWRQEIPRDLI